MEAQKKVKLYGKEHFRKFQNTIDGYKIVYIMAPFGWESMDFMDEYLSSYCNDNYLRIKSSVLEYDIDRLIGSFVRKKLLLVVTEFEELIKTNQLESVLEIVNKLPNNISMLLLSSLPLPPEFVPFSMEGYLVRIGEQELRPELEEVNIYFRKQGIILSNQEIEKINIDFGNMPLCIYLLVDYLKKSFYGYSSYINKQCWEEIYTYIDLVFFQPLALEVQNILLQLSYFNKFNKKLLGFLFSMGERESENILTRVYRHGNILKECGEEDYCFYPLMSRFLQRYIEKYVSIAERENIYKKAVKYYMDVGDYKETLRFLSVLKEENRLAEYLSELMEDLDIIKCKEMEEYFELLSKRTIQRYPVLIAGKVILGCCKGDKESAFTWYGMLENLKGEDSGIVRYLDLIMPFHETFDVIKSLNSVHGKKYIGKTDYIPSLIHGGLDFSLCVDEYLYVAETVEKNKRLEGQYSGMHQILRGEISYEKNDFNHAISYISRGITIALNRGNTDLVFVGKSVLCKIMLYSNQSTSVYEALNFLGEMLEGQENSPLYLNYQTLVVNCNLADNNVELIELWMKRWAPDENQDFCIFLRYQYLAKVKAYLSMGRYVNAQQLLDILKEYVADFNRPYLELKVYILESILFFRRENLDWVICLNQALELGEKMGFVRVFADEGVAIYPLLSEIRLKCKWKDNAYFREVLRATKKIMLIYPLYLDNKKDITSLTTAEMQVMKLLIYGKKNKEIANNLMVSENTVKYHLKNIYIKMGVSNRSQAVRVAAYYDKVQNYLLD